MPRQTIKNLDGRQQVMALYIAISLADWAAQEVPNVLDVELPPNCEVVGGSMTVTDTYNTTGTDTLAIGDSVTPARYLAATNLKAAARTAVVPTGYVTGYAGTPASVRLTRVPADTAATKGTVRVQLQYVQLGHADATQG